MSEENYVPAEQGIELLGEKASKFYYHVDRGEITTEVQSRPGKGKKNNRYLVDDILQVKRRLAEQRGRKRPAMLIDWVTPSDIPIALKLIQSVYGPEVDLAELAIYQSWRKHNNLLTIGAFNADRSTCYASMQLVPLPETVILDILAGRREENSILPDEIWSYARPGAYTLLATSAVVLPDRPVLLYELLKRYLAFWLEQYPERWISKVYAQTVSDSGFRLAAHMFMSPRRDLAYNAFELDMQYPPVAKMIKAFKDQMAEKAPLPPALQWPPVETPHIDIPIATHPQRRVPRQSTQEQKSDMPANLSGWREYARSKGIPEKDVLREIRAGRIETVKGSWKVGKVTVREALDEQGRKKVDRLNQSTDPMLPAADSARQERE